jgi:hypothetical protein
MVIRTPNRPHAVRPGVQGCWTLIHTGRRVPELPFLTVLMFSSFSILYFTTSVPEIPLFLAHEGKFDSKMTVA